MLPLLALALAAPPDPTTPSPDFPAAAQWAAVTACPKIVTLSGGYGTATGVAVGFKEGYAYVLTAAHAVAEDAKRQARFYAVDNYPISTKECPVAEVAVRLATPDVALLKVRVEKGSVPVLKLAKPGERPKTFPAEAFSVGCSNAAPPTCELVRIGAKRLVRRGEADVAFFWETPTPPVSGRSGGPLVSKDGKVIGICVAVQEGNGYYAHLDEILAGLKKHKYEWLWE